MGMKLNNRYLPSSADNFLSHKGKILGVKMALHCPVNKIANGSLSSDCTGVKHSVCTVYCQSGYGDFGKTHKIYCLGTGNWSTDLNKVCNQEPICPNYIKHGKIPSNCRRIEGEVCSYQCVEGYNRNPSYPVLGCTSDGKWHNGEEELCIFKSNIKCNSSIRGVMLDPFCSVYTNSTCNYNCLPGFTRRSNVTEITCQASGTWEPSLETVCQEIKCPTESLPHGQFLKYCTGAIDKLCDYSCDKGYTKNPYVPSVACLSIGNWSQDPNILCRKEIVECKERNPSIILNPECSTKAGDQCDFTCAVGYTKNEANVSCSASGNWQPEMKSLCKAVTCGSSLPNGKLSDGCQGSHGEHCSYTCNTGFTKSQTDLYVVCLSSGSWSSNLASLCRKDHLCDHPLENGLIVSRCDRKIGSSCEISCSDGLSPKAHSIVCLSSLEWSPLPSEACQKTVAIQSRVTNTEKKTSSTGFYVGLAALLVVLMLVSIVSVVFLINRKKLSKLSINKHKTKGKYVNSPNVHVNVKEEPTVTPPQTSHTLTAGFESTARDEMETTFDEMASGYQYTSNGSNEAVQNYEYETTAEIHSYGIYENSTGLVDNEDTNTQVSNPLYDNASSSGHFTSDMTTKEEITDPDSVQFDIESDTSPTNATFEYTKF